MLKNLLKLSATFILLICITASDVLASGKMEVKMGDRVTLQAEDLSGGSYKWVVKKGREILSTQSTSILNYVFNQQGEHDVVLTITDSSGGTKSTTVRVLVGELYSNLPEAGTVGGEGGLLGGVSLAVGLETLPLKTAQRSVHILGDEGRVVFDIGTRDDILEYRIDRNIFVDSDGNGITNDDIDNADHSSYLLGGMWQTKYLASESNKIAAEVTVVGKDGRKAKTQVEIIFSPAPQKQGSVVAVLDTLPVMDSENKTIYVYDELDTVAFYAGRSQGDIVEYRIDKNIFVDSDGDGNPANDIDNRNDPSFRTGDVWTTAYEKTDDQIIAQLIVVGRDGTGSRIQREIRFTDRPAVVIPEMPEPSAAIQLTADKDFVQKGDPITYTVSGLTQDAGRYIFDWDFNGDGETDQTVEGDNKVTFIYDSPGVQTVAVRVMDADGNEATFILNMLVKDTMATAADFEYTVEGRKVTFMDLSSVSPNLTSRVLSYTWSFGETDPESYEAQKGQIGVQNPVFTYAGEGTYVVTLTVVDSDQVMSTKSEMVFIAEVLAEDSLGDGAAEIVAKERSGGGSFIWTFIKVVFYIILVVILLVLVIVAGLLAFLKIQHPDLVFEELIDELKIKILAMMGVHEMIEAEERPDYRPSPPASDASSSDPEAGVRERSRADDTDYDEDEPVQNAELAKQDAPVPDWLKKSTPAQIQPSESEVVEGEVVESPAVEPSATKPDEGKDDVKKEDASVPDWLKND